MGNCVDKFIKKRINMNLIKILLVRSSLRNRYKIRENTNDYFNDICYEQDFSDIIKIRNLANELVNNCNKFLERISEQYSKLN